jgi:hypothetical protein
VQNAYHVHATADAAHLQENVAAASLRLTPKTSPASPGNGVDAARG